MTEEAAGRRRWILVRTLELAPEEEGVLTAFAADAAREGVELVTVLLGSAAYGAERSSQAAGSVPQVVWVLEDDYAGRGIRPGAEGAVRPVSSDELVQAIMSAEKVIPFS